MKTLLIMRHAKSSWQNEGQADHERPLNRRGHQAAPRMGAFLEQQGLRPEVVFVSTARRAQDTARLVVEAAGWEAPIHLTKQLYLAPPESYCETLRAEADPASCCLVIGHNPGLENLVAGLTGNHETMPTAAVAVVEFELEDWSQLHFPTPGRLAHFWRPREI